MTHRSLKTWQRGILLLVKIKEAKASFLNDSLFLYRISFIEDRKGGCLMFPVFSDKERMVEMYEVSLLRKKKTGKGWISILATSSFDLTDPKSQHIQNMLRIWLNEIKKVLQEGDVAYLINEGNVFILAHEDFFQQLIKSLSSVTVSSRDGSLLFTNIRLLEKSEIEFIFTLPNGGAK